MKYCEANETSDGTDARLYGEGVPAANGTKVWITKTGRCLLCNNASKMPEKVLRDIMGIIGARIGEAVEKRISVSRGASYYCKSGLTHTVTHT